MVNKIMLIDDDSSSLLYHQIIIDEENLTGELILCSSVDEAISYLSESNSPPDLIFLDMNMPLKNAWDFLRIFEARDLDPSSTIVILSTTKNPEDVKKALDNKLVSAFLTKPLDLNFIKTFSSKESPL